MKAQLGFVITLISCGSAGPAPPAPLAGPVRPAARQRSAPASAPPPAAPGRPELRLPTTVRPLRNAVELTVVPGRDDFTGAIATDLEVAVPTSRLWLDAAELTVTDARILVGGDSIPASSDAGDGGFLSLTPARPLPAGPARLVISYRGKMRRNEGDGIFTVEERGARYAFTQFEPTYARRAFPCFDEPSYKIPWQLTLHTERPLVALANTPVESERDEPGGMKAVRFAETRPLPSYLVAFAVGPFEAVDAGATRGGAPIRIVVPRGRSMDAAFAATATRPIVDWLEDYFGAPYPYPKLDMLAVPVFNVSAMENPGLITFRQDLILTRPAERTRQTERVYAGLAAHEVAHQWFGDSVTLAWWDDTWLNESFATWMASKVLAGSQPGWNVAVEQVHRKDSAIGADSLDAARAVRQPIETGNDIANAFDGITYAKGGAVLSMLERWIGPEVFRAGVQAYLSRHAGANATYDDFVTAMSAAARRDVRSVFDSFIRQSGVPLVTFELRCTGTAAPVLALSQRRYAPVGSHINRARTWHVPVCVRWGAGGATGRDCTMLDSADGELPLSARTCPDWVLPNEDELGYYRVLPRGDLLDRLLAHADRVLTLPERVGIIGDMKALVAGADLMPGKVLELVERLARDPSTDITDASVGVVAGIEAMVPPGLRSSYERLIRKLYRGRAIELGWHSKVGEDDDTRELRSTLLWLVAGAGKDAELGRQADALVARWFGDRTAIEPDLVGIALHVAARRGGPQLFDRLHAAARQTTDRIERSRLLGALGEFNDRTILARAMAITLGDEFDLRDSIVILQRSIAGTATRDATYAFVKDHFDDLAARLPERYRPYMASVFTAMCDDGRAAEIESFFRPRIEKFDGGPRIMQQALESLHLCAAARKAQSPGIVEFLRRH